MYPWGCQLTISVGLAACLGGNALASRQKVDWKASVSARGFSIDTEEGIQQLLTTEKHSVQFAAVNALAQARPKEEAVNEIKRFLATDRLWVRARAAIVLADLGDRSGLEQMRRDFREHVPESVSDARVLHNIQSRQRSGASDAGVSDVLDAAIALAKMGDPQVGPFVQLAAVRAQYAADRYRAVTALVALIANVSGEELEARRLHPEFVLEEVANSERDSTVRMILRSEMGKPYTKPDLAYRIFEAMKKSSHISQSECRELDICIKQKRAQARAATQSASAPESGSGCAGCPDE